MQRCGAGVGGAEIIGDLEPEPKTNLNKRFLQSGCQGEEKLISTSISLVLLLQKSVKQQYMAGAGAEIMDKVRAGAENK